MSQLDGRNPDHEIAIQSSTLLGSRIGRQEWRRGLHVHHWPAVNTSHQLRPNLDKFIKGSEVQREAMLKQFRDDHRDQFGEFLHTSLGDIYAYLFGYPDGMATQQADDPLESMFLTAKIRLEREFLSHWIGDVEVPELKDQAEAADYIGGLAACNAGVDHPLFDYLANDATHRQMEMFLRGEVIRNEVVDDEVALLAFGLQGAQKAVAVANLWDECGRGRLDHFHTYWLRRLIMSGVIEWHDFLSLRDANPWFARITSNTNNMLLTRPAYKQMAYGCFTVFEGWVQPHFRAILTGMDRLGKVDADARIYFDAHIAVDPRHSRELIDGIRWQCPELERRQLGNLARGAHLAVRAGCQQYEYWLNLFQREGYGA